MDSERIDLPSGITLNVAFAGPEDAPPVILLHGFPESHRTWRSLAPLLKDDYRLIMPDQRGFGKSDKPADPDAYRTEEIVGDLIALATVLGHEKYALVGHDWGGAAAWAAALRGGPHIEKLAIINAPHPALFQKAIIDDPEQRAASQYMRRFREMGMEAQIRAMGLPAFFDKSFSPHVPLKLIGGDEQARYLADWSEEGALEGMLAWYRASPILVPEMDEHVAYPDWLTKGVRRLDIPTLVIWGMDDKALLPGLLDGLDAQVGDLTIERLDGVGHFAPWQAADRIAGPLKAFLDA